jgi:hypothetical protein
MSGQEYVSTPPTSTSVHIYDVLKQCFWDAEGRSELFCDVYKHLSQKPSQERLYSTISDEYAGGD